VVLIVVAVPGRVSAHADLEERIDRVTAKIRTGGGTAELYLQRADLHRQHGEFEEAFSDLESARRLDPSLEAIRLARARTLFDAGKPAECLGELDVFLKGERGHAPGLLLRAQCLVKLGRVTQSIEDYTAAVDAFASPAPDLFIERARAQAALGRFESAVKGLDEGLAKLGPVPGLELAAIEYLRQEGSFSAALGRAVRMTGRSAAKESGLLLQAELLEQAGRWTEAGQRFQEVRDRIAAHPESRRATGAARDLEKQALAGVTRMQTRIAKPANAGTK